ncbi:hypothetical protein VB691_24090, partial [Crocosphaera sp. XPORK-15E]|nr:hypothetical protein [Crocosphaera sp. XPORK-15E]
GDNWEKGVYFLPLILKTGIVVIHQLPVNEDTLWLRVLGKGSTQKKAVEELVELPENNALKENLLEILANWRKNLELRDNLSSEEQEDIMNLSPAYLQQREDWKQEGLTEGRREMIENLLLVRFGKLDEEMKGVIAQLLQLPTEDVTRLLLNLSREDLLQRLRTDFIG